MAVTMMALSIHISANASPVERSQMLRAALLQRLTQDGWQLTQESQSLVTFERRSGVGETFLIHMLNGADASWAVERLSITLIPVSDHQTRFATAWSVNSQNVFGQTTSVPIRNRKTDAYINSVCQWASASLPAKYRVDRTPGITN